MFVVKFFPETHSHSEDRGSHLSGWRERHSINIRVPESNLLYVDESMWSILDILSYHHQAHWHCNLEEYRDEKKRHYFQFTHALPEHRYTFFLLRNQLLAKYGSRVVGFGSGENRVARPVLSSTDVLVAAFVYLFSLFIFRFVFSSRWILLFAGCT